MRDGRSVLATVLTWTVVGVLAIVAFRLLVRLLGLAMGLLGMVIGIAAFLTFTVGPIVLLGWILTRLWKALAREPAV